MDISASDRDQIIRTVYGEARGESPEGQAAVVHNILNRLKSGEYPDSIGGIIHQRNAYTAWQDQSRTLRNLSPQNPQYESIGKIVDQVTSGEIPDPTGGALNYANVAAIKGPLPDFAKTAPTAKIGAHTFFNPMKTAAAGSDYDLANDPNFPVEMPKQQYAPVASPGPGPTVMVPVGQPAQQITPNNYYNLEADQSFPVEMPKQETPPAAGPPITATGIARAGISGLEQGAIGLAGIPGDISSLMRWATGTPQNLIPTRGLPTSQDIQQRAEQTFGPLYQPQNPYERVAQTMGTFAPAAIGGPESLVSRLGTRVAAPALASEAAGALTQGTPYETPARIAGALGGGVAATGLVNKIASSGLLQSPSLEQLYQQRDALYNSPEVTGLRLHRGALVDFRDNLKQELLDKNIDVAEAPRVAGIIDRLASPRFGVHGTVKDFDLARQSLTGIPYTAGENRAVGIAKNAIDNYLGNVPQADVAAGDANAANAALLQARNTHAAIKRSEDITAALERAEFQAGAAHSGLNLENITRQQLKPILAQKTGVSKVPGFQDYTPEEINALRHVVVGSPYGNAIRWFGNLLGKGGGLGSLLAGGGAYEEARQYGATWPEAAAAGLLTLGLGHGMGRYGSYLARQQAARLENMLRMPLAKAQRSAVQANLLTPQAALSLAQRGLLAQPLIPRSTQQAGQ